MINYIKKSFDFYEVMIDEYYAGDIVSCDSTMIFILWDVKCIIIQDYELDEINKFCDNLNKEVL